ncbi:sirohydrochlorin chelatase [Staphylococcus simulans]|uniref:sirohydrochlorin chelatase n=1 Tax=Staphylococcus simulans TaxID=1286 RepID=UPI0021CE5405|nr:CbiX/SirB N-terminal domain-containing protein [Staphylococcus simulans]UXV41985.1 NirR protein [Staphylococcus simulans]
MTQTIVVMHGMRRGKQNQLLMEELDSVAQQIEGTFDVAFIESDELSLPQVIRKHLWEGETSFVIVPLLLFSGRHYLQDLPEVMRQMQLMFPSITYEIRQPLCDHPSLTKWINQRIEAWPDAHTPGSAIVLIGHGSPIVTEPDAEIDDIATRITTDLPVYTMMFYGDKQFEGLLPEMKEDYDQIYVIPIFFYDGFLVNKIKKKIEKIKGDSNITIASALNFEPKLDEMLIDRLNQKEAV